MTGGAGTLETASGGEVRTVSGDSVFDGTAAAVNLGNSSGYGVLVNDNTALTLKGTINNTALIQLYSTGDATNLVIDGNVTLEGGGQIEANGSSQDNIIGSSAGGTLTNFNNTIDGSNGQLGNGQLTLINDTGGMIESGSNLVINTGTNVITNYGTISAIAGGYLTTESTINNYGTLASAGGNLFLENLVDNAGTIDENGGNVHIDGGVTNTNLIETTGSGHIYVTSDIDNRAGTITIGGGGVLTLSDGGAIDDGTINDTDLIDVIGSGAIDNNASVTGDQVNVESGQTLTLAATLDLQYLDNAGTLEANGGTFTIDSGTSIFGPGSVLITGGGTANFQDAFNQAITFSGAGTLELAQSASFGATVTGFNSGDVVDLTDVAFAEDETVVWTQNGGSGTLQISTAATLDRILNLAGTYNQSDFALSTDSGSGTEVISSPTVVTVNGVNSSGNALANQAVTVSLGASNLGTISYQWLLNGQIIPGATNASYTPTVAAVGDTLAVVASFTDPTTAHADQITALACTVQSLNDDWTGAAGDGNWADPNNWDEGVPISTMNALIDANGSYTVTILSATSANAATLTLDSSNAERFRIKARSRSMAH